MTTKLGILLWNQASDWPDYERAARRIDELGYDYLLAWDHLYAIFGDPYQPIFEGYTSLAAWAGMTKQVRLGLLVGANTFRNPAVVAKMLTTIDHASGGRAVAGIGGAWMELEHQAAGIDFGSGFGERLDWMEETADALEMMFAGRRYSSPPGAHYQLDDFALLPAPVQSRLPI
ncbi:MAG TPA: LLM class flavin-dependent oxidoreductase, partial [Candidatus Limnocylindrales bacterium]|nr:LLM class flavin-dependent oxidoreductase [Candidatus Limnocylindrales bacterium]